MSKDRTQYGTGNELGRIPLGDEGDLVIKDDGCFDSDISLRFEKSDGSDPGFYRWAAATREDMGDGDFMEFLKELSQDPSEDTGGSIVSRSTLYNGPGPFTCDDCGLTCPSKWNRTPDASEDICKNCHEGDD